MLPSVPNLTPRYTRTQLSFGGIDKTRENRDGGIESMKNISCRDFPALACREKRYIAGQRMIAAGVFDCTGYGGMPVSIDENRQINISDFPVGTLPESVNKYAPIHFAQLQDTVMIAESKQLLYLKEFSVKSMELYLNTPPQSAVFSDGTLFGEQAAANKLTILYDNSTLTVPDLLALGFKVGDLVTISSNNVDNSYTQTAIIREIDGNAFLFDENIFTLPNGEAYTEESSICVKRTVPDMDYIFSSGGRLWGCKDDTIYASKLQDPFNWYVYDGLESDSWTLTTGTGGAFTGACEYLGYPTFFKADRIIKIYGSSPDTFRTVETETDGVAVGCGETLCRVGNRLYYLSNSGVMQYGGSWPTVISEKLGRGGLKIVGVCAGTNGDRYYIRMKLPSTEEAVYCYDTLSRQWYAEDWCIKDGIRAPEFIKQFFSYHEHLYALGAYGSLTTVGALPMEAAFAYGSSRNPVTWTAEKDVDFEITTGDIMQGQLTEKALHRLIVQLQTEDDFKGATVFVDYDRQERWIQLERITRKGITTQVITPRLRRCGSFRVKIKGVGSCSLTGIVHEYSKA